jgi:hypothetical protein
MRVTTFVKNKGLRVVINPIHGHRDDYVIGVHVGNFPAEEVCEWFVNREQIVALVADLVKQAMNLPVPIIEEEE